MRKEIQVFTSGGWVAVDAEIIDIGELRGQFAVHERIPEARDCTTLFDDWTVTHITTGTALVRAGTRSKALHAAEQMLRTISQERLVALTHKWAEIQKRRRVRVERRSKWLMS